MYVYIWDQLGEVTDYYHSGGGLVIVARDLQHAKELAGEYSPNIVIDEDPDLVVPCRDMDENPTVFVFPNAGCC